MFEGIRRLFTKESAAWRAILSTGFRGPQWMASNYGAFAREGYVWNPTVYACINKTYAAFRGIQYGLYRQQGTGRKLVTKGPLAELIRHPNPRQSFGALMGEWAGSIELSGNAYIEGVSLQDRGDTILTSPPKELYILRPDRMFVVPGDPTIPIAGYEYRYGSVVVGYPVQLWRNPKTGAMAPRAPVSHSKYWNPTQEDGDYYGLSPVAAAARNIDAFNSAVQWNVALTQNTARPSGIFTTTDTTLGAQQAEEYTNLIRQKFSGASNAGRPMVVGKGLQWQQLGMSPVEMDWLMGLQWNSRQICAIFGIPPQLVGDETAKTYANYEEANRAVWMQKWLNMLDMVCDDLNAWLSPLFWETYGEEVTIGYDRDGIEAIQEDRQVKWQNAKDGAGFLRIDEQRALLGYEPLGPGEGGDTILVPVGMVPLAVSSAQSDMPAIAAAAAAPPPVAGSGRALPKPKPKLIPAAGAKPKPKPKPRKKADDYGDEAEEDLEPEAPLGVKLLEQIEAARDALKSLE